MHGMCQNLEPALFSPPPPPLPPPPLPPPPLPPPPPPPPRSLPVGGDREAEGGGARRTCSVGGEGQ